MEYLKDHNQLKVPSFQDTHSKTNQTQKSSQKRPDRCAEERDGQRIPKPERNRQSVNILNE